MRDILVAVGINNYKPIIRLSDVDPYDNLEWACDDSTKMQAWFQRQFKNSRCDPFPNSLARSIEGHLSDLPDHEGLDQGESLRNLVFFFAGHGEIVFGRRGSTTGVVSRDLGLHCTESAGMGSVNDLLRLTDIAQWMAGVGAECYFIVVDACLSASWAPEGFDRELEKQLGGIFQTNRQNTPWALLLPCSPGQVAVEDRERKAGLFVGCLLEEIGEGQGQRSWRECFSKVAARISQRWPVLQNSYPADYVGISEPLPQFFPRNNSHLTVEPGGRLVGIRQSSVDPLESIGTLDSLGPKTPSSSTSPLVSVRQGPLHAHGSEATKIPDFEISRELVGRAAFERFLRETKWPEPQLFRSGRGKPAMGLSFVDAEAFCQWHKFRLPSLFEWQRALQERLGLFEEQIWEWIDGGEFGRKLVKSPADPHLSRTLNWTESSRDIGFRYVEATGASNWPVDGLDNLIRVEAGRARLGVPRKLWNTLAKNLGLSPEEITRLASAFPARDEHIKAFQIRQYPVTNEEFFEFARYKRHFWPPVWTQSDGCMGLYTASEARPFLEKYRYHPVAGVTHEAAKAYCDWRDVRLPTNDEWEFAARGTLGLLYPWGNQFDPRFANFSQAELARTTRVDDYLHSGKSPFDCVDMCGNVSEWVDWDGSQRFLRGGSYVDDGLTGGLTFNRVSFDRLLVERGGLPPTGFRYIQS